jgi:hypothetical protein
VQRAQSRAGQDRDDGLGDHRHVDRDAVAGDQAEFGQRVGGLAHFGQQIAVGQRAFLADPLTLPVDRDALAVAGFDVPVHAVVGDVQFAASEPFGKRPRRPVQHLRERGVPREPVGLFGPERQPVLLGLLIQVIAGIGLRCKLFRWCIGGRCLGVRLGHPHEPSHVASVF